MEIKINKDVNEFTEQIFFGLSLRQLIFSLLAIGVAVGIYFGFGDMLGTEVVSWLCILGAVPFGAIGFIKYNSMTAEKFLMAYIKSEFLLPKELKFKGNNTYYEITKGNANDKNA